MIVRPKLSKAQYRFFASFLKTISEGIVLGSSAAFFFPGTLQLTNPISLGQYALFVSLGLLSLLFGAILELRGSKV